MVELILAIIVIILALKFKPIRAILIFAFFVWLIISIIATAISKPEAMRDIIVGLVCLFLGTFMMKHMFR